MPSIAVSRWRPCWACCTGFAHEAPKSAQPRLPRHWKIPRSDRTSCCFTTRSAASPGRSMQTADAAPVLVFDLDETILRVNSFPLWVRFLIAGRLPGLGWRRRALLSLHAQRLLLWRKLGRLSHDALRWRLLLAWQSATGHRRERFVARFQARLLREVRGNLRPLLAMVAAEQIDAVLATAAGAEYAEGLGRRLGFRYVLASRHDAHAATPA